MMPSTSVANFYAQVDGTLEAVVLACTSMIATHPEKGKVLALLAALSGHATESESDNEQTKHYKLGIRTAVATIAKGVQTAQLADHIRDLKRESGTH